MKVRVFGDSCGCAQGAIPAAPPVTVTNPWNCREQAVVQLSVDDCGNLLVSVRH